MQSRKTLFAKLSSAAMILMIVAVSMTVGCTPKPAPEKMGAYYPGTLTSALPNYPLPVMTFTATAQTVSAPLSGMSMCTVTASGTLTAATFTFSVSNDGGVTYYTAAVAPYGATITPVTTAITIASGTGAWVFNVGGWTNFKVVTSGTFTGTNLILQPTCTSNKGVI